MTAYTWKKELHCTCSYGNGQPLYTEPYHDVSKPTSYVKRTNENFSYSLRPEQQKNLVFNFFVLATS